jgi:peptidyl-Lys metalloendopeptidase
MPPASHAFSIKVPFAMKRLLCLTTALAMLMPACAKEQPVRIQCELSIAKSLRNAQPAELEFALTNAGEDVIKVLNWQTPFEGITAPMFTVMRDGAEVEYRGRMLKRSAPRKDDYLVLKPGERRRATINLADAWDVDAPGRYTVEYSAQLFDVIEGAASAPRSLDEFQEVTPDCNSVTFMRVR